MQMKPEIHTSDRLLFKRCRRKWDYSSPLRQYLEPADGSAIHFWLGTGFHFALEDFHGYNRFGDPRSAFLAYVKATQAAAGGELPAGAEEALDLTNGMFAHYLEDWLPRRNDIQTYWVNGEPQVEVKVALDLGPAIYVATFDRVVTDSYGRLFVEDYKTAARFNTSKLDTDPQITAYTWLASKLYRKLFSGVSYVQFVKAVPELPDILKSGAISKNKAQNTTQKLYRQAVLEAHGGTIPAEYQEVLNYFMMQETPEGDKFIRRDLVMRNAHQIAAEEQKVHWEMADMLADLPIYPNPTHDCAWDCDFKSLCLAQDDGSDVEWFKQNAYRKRQSFHPWREFLEWPKGAPVAAR